MDRRSSDPRPSGKKTGATAVDGDPDGRPGNGSAVEKRSVPTNGIETYCERRGDGPPVVFVHGAVMDHSQWTPQVGALADDYTTVAYDVRGHGRTGPSAVDRYSVELFAADLHALVGALDLDRPVVCGLSTGGCIAQVYADRYPEDLSALVLADTFTTHVLDWRDRLQFAVLNAAVPAVRLVGYPRVQRFMTRVQELFNRGAGGDYDRIERLQAAGPRMDTDEFAKVIRALTRFRESDVDLSAVAVPTLVLYGEHTTGLIQRHTAKLAAEVPGAVVREVPGAGHACNLDNPDFFSSALREFLAERVGGDP